MKGNLINKLFFESLNINYLSIFKVDNLTILKLKKLEFEYIYQVLYNFPHKYRIYKHTNSFRLTESGENIVILGTFVSLNVYKTMLRATFIDNIGKIFTAIWFNSTFLLKVLIKNNKYLLFGKKQNAMLQPKIRSVDKDISKSNLIIPVYKKDISKIILEVLVKIGKCIYGTIDDSYIRMKSFFNIHIPNNEIEIEKARQFFHQEKSFMYLSVFKDNKITKSFTLKNTYFLVEQFCQERSIILTKKQTQAFIKIINTALLGKSFNVLLHGDVASGKTFVALALSLFFIFNGYKVIFVVPTTALFEQTMKFLTQKIGDFFTIKEFKHNENYDTTDIIVSTHSITYGSDVINDVGLIIIDEEQKFGVLQREKMIEKCVLRNSVLLSATPIPRTLSLLENEEITSVFLESSPRDLKGTIMFLEDRLWITEIKKRIKTEKILCVTPRIDSGEYSAKAVMEIFSNENNVDLVHGKMSSVYQQNCITEFSDNEKGLLICTSVLEVGVNIENLNVVFILNANLFGLSQLHQIRGRVGRETGKGEFVFVISNQSSEEVQNKLESMCSIQEGHKVSELDIINRGSGDIYGTHQSGYFEIYDIKIKKIVESMSIVKRKLITEFLLEIFKNEFEKRNN